MLISQNIALEIRFIIFVKHEVHLHDVTFSLFMVNIPDSINKSVLKITLIQINLLYIVVCSTLDARSSLTNNELKTVMLNQQKRSTLRTVKL